MKQNILQAHCATVLLTANKNSVDYNVTWRPVDQRSIELKVEVKQNALGKIS